MTLKLVNETDSEFARLVTKRLCNLHPETHRFHKIAESVLLLDNQECVLAVISHRHFNLIEQAVISDITSLPFGG